MATNDFLPFTPTDTGTNLLTQSEYLVATGRDIGNQPGVASAKLNNKAIRQATFITAGLAQYISDTLAANVLDDSDDAAFLSQLNQTFSGIVNTTTKTANYTAGANDYYIGCSGSAFTITLPTAVGRKKVYVIKKTDSSLSNIITIATTGGQTIDGASTTTLNTLNEDVTLMSDGANWQILNRRIPATWTNSTITISAVTTPPSFGTVTTNKYNWRRVGGNAEIFLQFVTSSGGSAGTGTYLFPMPSGLTIDTAQLTPSTTGVQAGLGAASATTSGTNGTGIVTAYDSTNLNVLLVGTAQTNLINSGFFNSAAAVIYNFMITVPISGWKV
jgi:hypothetical protein